MRKVIHRKVILCVITSMTRTYRNIVGFVYSADADVFRVILHVFPVMLEETRATLQETRSTLRETPATLQETPS